MSGTSGIRGILVKPGQAPEIVEIEQGLNKDRTNLEALQKAVGGHIETVTLHDGAVLICNEEGRASQDPNRMIVSKETCKVSGLIYGTFLICGQEGDDIRSLPLDLLAKYMRRLSSPKLMVID